MSVTTRPTRRARSGQAPRKTDTAAARGFGGWLWAGAQLGIFGVQVLALLLLLAYPGFRPTVLEVTGATHLTRSEVVAALGIPSDRSIFLLDHVQLESRLGRLPWVESATVSLTLPDRVQVTINEWTPAAVLQQGERSYFLSPQGRLLGPAPEAGSLPIVERPQLTSLQPGTAVLPLELEAMLAPLSAGFPQAYHLRVAAFVLDDRQDLTIRTDRGFPIYFGQMATADQRAGLETKLGALKALATRVDLVAGPIAYVNLMNPAAPAVQFRPSR